MGTCALRHLTEAGITSPARPGARRSSNWPLHSKRSRSRSTTSNASPRPRTSRETTRCATRPGRARTTSAFGTATCRGLRDARSVGLWTAQQRRHGQGKRLAGPSPDAAAVGRHRAALLRGSCRIRRSRRTRGAALADPRQPSPARARHGGGRVDLTGPERGGEDLAGDTSSPLTHRSWPVPPKMKSLPAPPSRSSAPPLPHRSSAASPLSMTSFPFRGEAMPTSSRTPANGSRFGRGTGARPYV